MSLTWKAAFGNTLVVVAFRALPFLCYVMGQRRISVPVKLGCLLVYCALVLLAGTQARDSLPWWLLGVGYFGVAAVLVHWISKATHMIASFDAFLAFAAMFALFVAIPAFGLKQVAAGTFLIVGWDLVLKSYSYLMEARAFQSRLGDCVFFLLVDPSVVFVQRATRNGDESPCERVCVWLRMGSAVVVLFAGFLLAPIVLSKSREVVGIDRETVSLLPAIVSHGFVLFILGYSQHSSVASVQISLTRLIGFRVAERYRYPFLAQSPLEFWARWNIYVGQWAKRYIFLPVALKLKRLQRGALGASAAVVAAGVVFAAIGLYHDAYTSIAEGRPTLRITGFFLANAVLVWIWVVSGACFAPSGRWTRLRRHGSRAIFVTSFLLLLGVWSKNPYL